MSELVSTAVVTGGTRGIGRAIALKLAQDGYQVFLTYVSKPAEAEKVCEEITTAGGAAQAFALNVGDPEAVAAFFADNIKGKVDLDVLVNNAGITKDGLLIRMKDEDFERVVDINLNGTFTCMREAAKLMTRQRKGKIINITSVVGQSGNPGQANYVASKAGIIGMTKSVAQELAARNITVNAVAPGFIETDMTAELGDKARDTLMQRIPLKKMGAPEDIANAVSFLASEQASYITGQTLAVNGGMYM